MQPDYPSPADDWRDTYRQRRVFTPVKGNKANDRWKADEGTPWLFGDDRKNSYKLGEGYYVSAWVWWTHGFVEWRDAPYRENIAGPEDLIHRDELRIAISTHGGIHRSMGLSSAHLACEL